MMPILRGAPAKAATAICGAPLATNAIDGPLPRPKSALSEAKACCSLASPPALLISTLMPYLAKMPFCCPTSSTVKVQATDAALIARTVSAASAWAAPSASAAPHKSRLPSFISSSPLFEL